MFKLLLPSHFVMIVTYFLLGMKDEQSDIGNPIPTPRIIKRVPLISRWTFHFPITVSSSTQAKSYPSWELPHFSSRKTTGFFISSILHLPMQVNVPQSGCSTTH